MTGAAFDRRVTPIRADLAASFLRGTLDAPRYADGDLATVAAEIADLRRSPAADASLDTQLLHGEAVRVFDRADGWAWVQAERDCYVGYVVAEALRVGDGPAATHRVVVRRSFVYPAADMKRPPRAALPLDAHVAVEGEAGEYVALATGGYVFARHLAPLTSLAADASAIAESLIGTPYLWGGKSGLGIDCSGLVQLAYALTGVALPRDTDMQETCGRVGPIAAHDLRRGDLVFWKGHVGIMRDPATLLHANAHHMLVASEPLDAAIARNADAGGENPRSFARIG